MKDFKNISIPLKYVNISQNLYCNEGNKNPIVSCKNKRKNFYATTHIEKWHDEYNASHGWRLTKKYCNDHFTINSKLPALDIHKCGFEELGLNTNIVKVLYQQGYKQPTNVQISSIPVILTGVNTIIGGETGSGKTLAYLSPILNNLITNDKLIETSICPRSIIIAPTWELCHQIYKVTLTLATYLNLNCCLFRSFNDINVDSDIIVTNPHCLTIAMKHGDISTKKLKSVIMDEADMLLDKSFADVTCAILSSLSIQTSKPLDGNSIGSQLILSNATCPNSLEEFGNFIPIDSFAVLIGNAMHRLIPNISHKFIRTTKLQKSVLLITLLKRKGLNKSPFTIIFCNNNEFVQNVSSILQENGIEHVCLHQRISLQMRQHNFNKFQNGDVRVLVSTDLGSRGLDTIKATHIINYEFPRFIADYLHRAGRIGRVGSNGVGKVINLISSKEEINSVQIIEKSIRCGIPLPIIDTNERTKDK